MWQHHSAQQSPAEQESRSCEEPLQHPLKPDTLLPMVSECLSPKPDASVTEG